jgi:hypothetical protein
MILCFFGPDGSGKSTITERLQKHFNKKSHVRHWRPGILPRRYAEGTIYTSPHETKERNLIMSIFLYFYYFIDFYLFELAHKYLYKDKIFFYERYFHDIMIHPKRYGVKKIPLLPNFLNFLLSEKKHYILFNGDEKKIFSRKPELMINEIKRQNKEYKLMLMNEKAYIFDTTSNTSEKIFYQILNIIKKIK